VFRLSYLPPYWHFWGSVVVCFLSSSSIMSTDFVVLVLCHVLNVTGLRHMLLEQLVHRWTRHGRYSVLLQGLCRPITQQRILLHHPLSVENTNQLLCGDLLSFLRFIDTHTSTFSQHLCDVYLNCNRNKLLFIMVINTSWTFSCTSCSFLGHLSPLTRNVVWNSGLGFEFFWEQISNKY